MIDCEIQADSQHYLHVSGAALFATHSAGFWHIKRQLNFSLDISVGS